LRHARSILNQNTSSPSFKSHCEGCNSPTHFCGGSIYPDPREIKPHSKATVVVNHHSILEEHSRNLSPCIGKQLVQELRIFRTATKSVSFETSQLNSHEPSIATVLGASHEGCPTQFCSTFSAEPSRYFSGGRADSRIEESKIFHDKAQKGR